MNIEAVDLFCGAGGLTYGLQKAGVKVKLGVDIDPACEFPFTENNQAKFLSKSVTEFSGEELSVHYAPGVIRLLAGCAPCQPFSTLSNGQDREKSDKWPLLNEFGRLVESVKPDYVTMENVPALKAQEIFADFVKTLTENGYYVSAKVVNAAAYGLPQRRKRLVLLASKKGAIELLSPKELGAKLRTVKDAIGMLPKVQSGEKNPTDPLHQAPLLGEKNMARIRASKPGGTWADWPEELLSPCHTKEKGASFKSVYGRMEWSKPSPTITTQSYNFGTGRFGHPDQDRAITLREAAILQSFPKGYKFVDKKKPVAFSTLGRLIGNAVPVDLGYAIGMTIIKHASNSQKQGKK